MNKFIKLLLIVIVVFSLLFGVLVYSSAYDNKEKTDVIPAVSTILHTNTVSHITVSPIVVEERNPDENTYFIKINNEANTVTIYIKLNEEYVPFKSMVCSTGTDTPKTGIFSISNRWEWLSLFGDVYGMYSTQIIGDILFHSVPYLNKNDAGSLKYLEYDKLRNICLCWLYTPSSYR